MQYLYNKHVFYQYILFCFLPSYNFLQQKYRKLDEEKLQEVIHFYLLEVVLWYCMMMLRDITYIFKKCHTACIKCECIYIYLQYCILNVNTEG